MAVKKKNPRAGLGGDVAAFQVLSEEADKGWRDRALVDAFIAALR